MHTETPELPAVRLAIVDDHRLFRQGLKHLLGYEPRYEVVLEAASGAELFAALQAGLPLDIVLLDLHMPGMDGRQVSQQLLEQYPQVRIIILSMEYAHEFVLELLQLGVHAYLPKDTDAQQLELAIEQVYRQGYYIDDAMAHLMRNSLKNNKKTTKHSTVAPTALLSELTAREREVLRLLCEGCSSADIAERLFISMRTVEGHRTHLLEKTGANNAVSLAVFAVRHQLL